jgi:hypothetical protein
MRTPEKSPDTGTGVNASVAVLFPSSPLALWPQHCKPPEDVSAHPCALPSEIPVSVTHVANQQKLPDAQSVSTAHWGHEKGPHDLGEHEAVVPATHAPAPLQVEALVWVLPLHDWARQTVPEAQSWHAPLWHVPSVPQVAAAVAMHTPRGSAVPFVAVLQVPFTPPVRSAEQAWQAPVQATLQQTPSTQKPLVHWLLPVHVAPFAPLATHVTPKQKCAAAHCASVVQLVLHAFVAHT